MLTNTHLEIIIVALFLLIAILPYILRYLARPKNTPGDDMHDVITLSDKPFYYE